MSESPQIIRPEPTRGVFAFIQDSNGAVLLSEYRDRLHWNLPGGGVRDGETDEEALVREVLDETGLLVDVLAQIGDALVKDSDTAVLYRCVIASGNLVPTRESRSHRFLFLQDIKPGEIIGGEEGRMMHMIREGFVASDRSGCH